MEYYVFTIEYQKKRSLRQKRNLPFLFSSRTLLFQSVFGDRKAILKKKRKKKKKKMTMKKKRGLFGGLIMSLLLLLLVAEGKVWCSEEQDFFSASGSHEFLCETPVDLVLVLDGSASIAEDEWVEALSFCLDLVEAFNITTTTAHVGIVSFSDTPTTVLSLSGDASLVQQTLEIMSRPSGGGTNTALAITAASNVFATTGRAGIPHVMIVITDGNCKSSCSCSSYSSCSYSFSSSLFSYVIFISSSIQI
jgi:hypothetical protein